MELDIITHSSWVNFSKQFMNDPNGLHKDAKGTYHLYYQCTRSLASISQMTYTQGFRQPDRSCRREPALGTRDQQRPLPLGESAHRNLPAYIGLAGIQWLRRH